MKIEMATIAGIPQRVLLIEKDDKSSLCENCTKPFYNHPDLAKEDADWCIRCNDDEYRPEMTETELAIWSLEQIRQGKIIVVVTEEQP